MRSARARRQAATATRRASSVCSAPSGASSSTSALSSAANSTASSSGSTTYFCAHAVLQGILRRPRLCPRASSARATSRRSATRLGVGALLDLRGAAARGAAPSFDMTGFSAWLVREEENGEEGRPAGRSPGQDQSNPILGILSRARQPRLSPVYQPGLALQGPLRLQESRHAQ